jgi:glycosyltransferase involved in cell wall biosynthesis
MKKTKLKIVHINSGYQGSIGSIIANIIEKSSKKGFESYIATASSRKINKDIDNHIIIGNVLERNLHILLAKLTGLNGCFSWISTKLFLMKINKIDPQIIHLHNLHNCYINLSLLFKYIKKHDISIIWTLHDCWAFTGQCPHFEDISCNKWKVKCEKCSQIDRYPSAYVDQTKKMYQMKKKWFTGVRNLTIVTPSNWLANLVKQSYLQEYPVEVVVSGIDLDIFKPVISNFRDEHRLKNEFILLGVAFSWGYRKGLDAFIELSKELDDRFKIVLVGLTNMSMNNLPSQIIGIEKTNSQKELAEIYSSADIFINPTREEVLGLVNIEALACGIPVISFDSGGSPECISEDSGFVVEKGDIHTIIEKIYYIKSNPISKEICTERAKKFDGKIVYDKYVEIYEDINQ